MRWVAGTFPRQVRSLSETHTTCSPDSNGSVLVVVWWRFGSGADTASNPAPETGRDGKGMGFNPCKSV
jgi:hypothetical protein